jgi:hypothetical protein
MVVTHHTSRSSPVVNGALEVAAREFDAVTIERQRGVRQNVQGSFDPNSHDLDYRAIERRPIEPVDEVILALRSHVYRAHYPLTAAIWWGATM